MRVEVATLPPAGYGDIALTLYYFNVPEIRRPRSFDVYFSGCHMSACWCDYFALLMQEIYSDSPFSDSPDSTTEENGRLIGGKSPAKNPI